MTQYTVHHAYVLVSVCVKTRNQAERSKMGAALSHMGTSVIA